MSTRTSITLTDRCIRLLKAEAARLEISVSDLIRRMVEEKLGDGK